VREAYETPEKGDKNKFIGSETFGRNNPSHAVFQEEGENKYNWEHKSRRKRSLTTTGLLCKEQKKFLKKGGGRG